MASNDTSGPAFPTDEYYDEKRYSVMHGMTLRDYFAAKAMAAYLTTDGRGNVPENVAWFAYRQADAMLKERAK